MKRTLLFSTLAAALPALAQTAPTAATAFPSNVQADLVVVQQDFTALHAAFQQLKADRSANAANVPADRSAAALARLQLRMDLGKLHLDAAPVLQADAAALQSALMKLHADQVANSAGAVTADQAMVKTAAQQARADAKALHLGGGRGHGHGHGKSWHHD
ncbi:MAG TPA: hypothetical protein VH040_15760 [Usitatibacter sp.]|nr:hypothetical protein [Usitatibacter sp.]